MNNGLGEAQTVVLLGGTSEIGLAIVDELIGAATKRIVLCCRNTTTGEAAAADVRATHPALTVDVYAFDGAQPQTHEDVIERVAADVGDLDVVIVAFALLGDGSNITDIAAATEIAQVNYTGTMSALIAVGNRLRRQGHGSIVLLSSVAGERVRKHNPVYGSTKAGIDAFAQGYGDALAADGVHMLIVRPGFVHTKMTEGMDAAPLSTNPKVVAKAAASGLRSKRRVVWAPGPLRYVFSALRHVPGPVWRRLPLG